MILHAEDALRKLSSVLIDGTPLMKEGDRKYGELERFSPSQMVRHQADWFEHHE